MRKLTLRDLLATLITAAVVVPFVGYSVRGPIPFVQDPRGMAGVVIAGTVLAFAVFGRKAFGTGAYEMVTGRPTLRHIDLSVRPHRPAGRALLACRTADRERRSSGTQSHLAIRLPASGICS